jgi:hypothetical protein
MCSRDPDGSIFDKTSLLEWLTAQRPSSLAAMERSGIATSVASYSAFDLFNNF